jgi:gamma-glutamylcyclotransferase (GGCT)/AIG2-like uncharacterized protein YtfP
VSQGDFHLFVYGTLKKGGSGVQLLSGCDWLGKAAVQGTLYNIDGRFPALMLYGVTSVQGEVWRCPFEKLAALDAHEGLGDGMFRRVAVQVGDFACWTYVAGPALAPQLTPERRITSGIWVLA